MANKYFDIYDFLEEEEKIKVIFETDSYNNSDLDQNTNS